MKKSWCILLISIFMAVPLFSQVWLSRYNGTANDEDQAWDVMVDSSGNIYVTGTSWGSGTSYDYATVKYNASGTEQWVARFDGSAHGSDEARAMLMNNNRIIVTGGTSNASFYTDIATVWYNSDGSLASIAYYDDSISGNDFGLAIAGDSNGNVYVTGYGSGSTTGWDLVTVKYNSSGAQQWVKYYTTTDEDYGVGAVISPAGYIYVAGNSGSPYYFTWDYVTIRYNPNTGDTIWVRRYNGPANEHDEVRSIALDSDGNIYVTGGSANTGSGADFTTIKYSPSGQELWVRRYNGPANGSDWANAIAVDADNNIYVTGYSQGITSDYDYATIKYDANGNQLWVTRYNGPSSGYDESKAIAADNLGNIYVTGTSCGVGTQSDYAIVKYSSVGSQEWVHRYNGPTSQQDDGTAIIFDPIGSICVTGNSTGSGTGLDYATLKYALSSIVEESDNNRLNSNNVIIFPNPVKSMIYVNSQAAVKSIEIFDVSGKLVKKADVTSQPISIKLDGIRKGVYFIHVQTNNNLTNTVKKTIITD